MITLKNLPVEYTPFQEITFCSNRLIDNTYIMSIGENLPLLIGKGDTPRVWIQAVASRETGTFISLVQDSKSTHPNIEVRTMGGRVSIFVGQERILEVQSTGPNSATVSAINFRPIGLNIHGDSDVLNIGSARLSGNTFQGATIAFGLG